MNKKKKEKTSNIWYKPSHLKNMRPINKHDYTLTEEENEILKQRGYNGRCCCCCDSTRVEKIIKRPFSSCGVCYCCVGDDPFFDDKDLCIFVSEDLKNSFVFTDKNCPYKYYSE